MRVIVAHCVSVESPIWTLGRTDTAYPALELFARLMQEPRYDGLLFGDISTITQINRVGPALQTVVKRDEWQPRLVNGSDYPLPDVLPLFSLKQMVRLGYITEPDAEVLSTIRRYNPLLFDFVLKRALRIDGKGFSPAPFQTREFFEPT